MIDWAFNVKLLKVSWFDCELPWGTADFYKKNQLTNWIIFKGFVLFKNHFDDVIQINGLWLSNRTFFKTLMSDDFFN